MRCATSSLCLFFSALFFVRAYRGEDGGDVKKPTAAAPLPPRDMSEQVQQRERLTRTGVTNPVTSPTAVERDVYLSGDVERWTAFLNYLRAESYDKSHMCRKAMWDKLLSLQDERVMVMNKTDFNEETFVGKLPVSGAVLFVVDDPFRSTDVTTTCDDPSVLDDERILAVAAEDTMCNHTKMNLIPIGMESKLITGQKGDSALATFMMLVEKPIPTSQRKYNVQSDAHLHIFKSPASDDRDDRADMLRGVDKEVIDDWYEHHIDFVSHLRNHVADAKFALCPEGHGMDTHRFYHNYALRTRCIVREGHLSQLHRQFPGTIVVNDWHEVTIENIEKWIAEPVAPFEGELLTSDYWISKFLDPYNISTSVITVGSIT